MRVTIDEIIEATGGRRIGRAGKPCTGVGTDTRTLEPGALFVAIAGPHFDGHAFLNDAVAKGAAALLVREGAELPDGACAVAVSDTVVALGDLAAWWRSRFAVPCIAITGSNGKSTTKEMTAAALASLGPVLKTEGNFNNLIGLPLTALRWRDEYGAAVLEMGMNAPGEIDRLTTIARPDVGLITNVTAAHLERLHTIEAVAEAKGELFAAMAPEATAIVNAEDPLVVRMAKRHRGPRITFGMQNDADVRFLHMESDDLQSMRVRFAAAGREIAAQLAVPGAHNVMNMLAAVGIGIALGVDPEEAAGRIEDFHPMAMRFERVQLSNGVCVINDSYNANPESMRAAFRTVGAARRAGRFVAALGEMLELGAAAEELHRQVGGDAARLGVEELLACGSHAAALADGARAAGLDAERVRVLPDAEAIAPLLEAELAAGDILLVKGSRGVRMERVVDHLKRRIGTG